MNGDRLEARADGSHLVPAAVWPTGHILALAVSAVCLAIESASRQAGLVLEDEARVIRLANASWPDPTDASGGVTV